MSFLTLGSFKEYAWRVYADIYVLGGFYCSPNMFDPFEVILTLTWQLEAPTYVSDLNIYVW